MTSDTMSGYRQSLARALEVVAVRDALLELGFVPSNPCGEVLEWNTVHGGVGLRVVGDMDFAGRFRLTGISNTSRHAQYEERLAPDTAPRGAFVRIVLELWETAFGRATVPVCLAAGWHYRQYLRDLRKAATRTPALHVDPDVFRATLRWLQERHVDDDGSATVELTFASGMLWLRTERVSFAVPATGLWVDAVRVPLRALTGLSPTARRGRIVIGQQHDAVVVNGVHLAAVWMDEQAGNG